jgi:hypothetical protein
MEERFWSKVVKNGPDECWGWTAFIAPDGYSKFSVRHDYQAPAHRVAYELSIGPIPDGLHLDHLCRNRGCVNPAHLEPVTCGENLRRSPLTLNGIALAKTHCPQGHEYTEENTRMNGASRICRTCARDYMRRKRAVAKWTPTVQAMNFL